LPRDPDPALDQTQLGIAICGFLNNAWSAEAAARTCQHQLVIESGIGPALKPDERHVPQVPQPNSGQFCQGMPFGHGQQQSFPRELPMRQVAVPWCDCRGEADIQPVGQDRVNLMHREQMVDPRDQI
jgi:hypothetical protein